MSARDQGPRDREGGTRVAIGHEDCPGNSVLRSQPLLRFGRVSVSAWAPHLGNGETPRWSTVATVEHAATFSSGPAPPDRHPLLPTVLNARQGAGAGREGTAGRLTEVTPRADLA